MKKIIVGLLVIVMFVASGSIAFAATRVSGYFRSNGTYVAPHYRSSPNSNFYDNYSTKGNYNPYTGTKGYKTHPSYSRY